VRGFVQIDAQFPARSLGKSSHFTSSLMEASLLTANGLKQTVVALDVALTDVIEDYTCRSYRRWYVLYSSLNSKSTSTYPRPKRQDWARTMFLIAVRLKVWFF
jgi:hypothetical protein